MGQLPSQYQNYYYQLHELECTAPTTTTSTYMITAIQSVVITIGLHMGKK